MDHRSVYDKHRLQVGEVVHPVVDTLTSQLLRLQGSMHFWFGSLPQVVQVPHRA